MNEPANLLSFGTRVRTHRQLGAAAGMLVAPCHLAARPDASGVVDGVVGGHGGDVYWVRHEGEVAAYCWDEFELELETVEVEPS